MKIVASLLITVSLVLGTIAGVCAYLPKVSAIDPADELVLAAPAGANPDAPEEPLLDPGDHPIVLTADVIAQLTEANVKRVRVKSFAFRRWSLGWLFGVSCIGLIVGAWMIRKAVRNNVVVPTGSDAKLNPEDLLGGALEQIQCLHGVVKNAPAPDARRQIIDQLDDVFRNKFDGFVESRPVLINRLGMAGYAQLMDRFAAAERQLNRAWSAAADRVLDESLECLAEGETRLQEAIDRLGQSS